MGVIFRLLKNTHLLRCTRLPLLRRTLKYASFLEPSCALHMGVFDQPEIADFFSGPILKGVFIAGALLALAFPFAAGAQDTGPGSPPSPEPGSDAGNLFPRTDVEQEIKQTESELERLRQDLEAKRREAAQIADREQDLLGEIERINGEMEVNRQLLAKLDEKKAVLMEDLDATNADLRTAENRLSDAEDVLAKRLRAMYKFGRVEVMEIILMSRTFADLAKRVYYLSMVAGHDLELISAFEERVETRRVLLEHIELKKARLEEVGREVERETHNLELKKEERDALVARLKEKRYYYENLARSLEEASRNLEDLLADLEVKRDKVRYEGMPFEGGSGRLMWPCEGTVVTEFGVETHPRFGTIIRSNGIDIKALPGTKVRAVARGDVSFAGTIAGFGSCVVISHGAGFYTLYGHLESIIVSQGFPVGEGDAVGTIGETSTPEGAVLHFEIRRGTEPLDPMEWLRR
jgi:septal ring factor EnvC (AmiA/AmiB activator)